MATVRVITLEQTAATAKGYVERTFLADGPTMSAARAVARRKARGERLDVIPQSDSMETWLMSAPGEDAEALLKLWDKEHPKP